MNSFLFLLLAAALSTAGNLSLKLSKTSSIDFLPIWVNDLNPLFFSAVFFYMLNLLAFSKALETLPVNVGYPVLASLGFLMLAITSVFLLKENLSIVQICGMVMVSVGIFMLASKDIF
jgi:multidrug transporter EmrE-like cation transporter